jgi:hypothetical protein
MRDVDESVDESGAGFFRAIGIALAIEAAVVFAGTAGVVMALIVFGG